MDSGLRDRSKTHLRGFRYCSHIQGNRMSVLVSRGKNVLGLGKYKAFSSWAYKITSQMTKTVFFVMFSSRNGCKSGTEELERFTVSN